MRKEAFIVAALLLGLGVPPAAAIEPAKEAAIERLLVAVGTTDLVRSGLGNLLPQLLANLRRNNPRVPDEFWPEIETIMRQELDASVPEMLQPFAAIYDDNYSTAEIDQLLAFYESPVGRKSVERMPVILQQSMAVGQVIGTRFGQRLEQRIREWAKEKGIPL